jgi:protein phosphatase
VIILKLSGFAICGTGRIRAENQDNFFLNGVCRENITDSSIFRHGNQSPGRGVYAVADGMGGEAHGAVAALAAVQSMGCRDFFRDTGAMPRYLLEVNNAICGLIEANGGGRIGSTFAGLCISGKIAALTNIGDSRAYRLRKRELEQLSKDHTAVRQMVELGVITPEAALTHPGRHKLTQHLGIFPSEMLIEPYTVSTRIKSGDIFLLCSDGLTDMLKDDEIKSVLMTNAPAEIKAETLFERAMINGGKDNITILLVETKGGLFR